MIVSATRGEAGQIRDAASATRATLGQARERELRAACRCLGVQEVRLLDHLDGTLAGLDQEAFTEEVGPSSTSSAPMSWSPSVTTGSTAIPTT